MVSGEKSYQSDVVILLQDSATGVIELRMMTVYL